MKRFHCFLLALLLLFSASVAALPLASAEELGGGCGTPDPEAMLWLLDTGSGILTLTGSGSMEDFAPGAAPWAKYHTAITEVQFSEQIASVGMNAFTVPAATPAEPEPSATAPDAPAPATPPDPTTEPQPDVPGEGTKGYPCLLSLTLPASVARIGDNAFSGCSVLSSLTILDPACVIGANIGDPAQLTICGYTGSTAQTYADTWGYRFVPLDTGEHTHSWREITRELPDCETYGVIVSFCDGCGESETISIPPLGHDAVTDAAVAPTCVDDGLTEGSHCRRCGAVLTAQKAVAALGHSWDEGEVTREPTVIREGEKRFTCTRCAQTRTEAIPRTWFVDVPRKSYYAPAVEWAVVNDVTKGIDETHFAPKDTCTRGQVVTFLWRVAGKPTPAAEYNPFEDVRRDSFCYKAVLWAVEHRITKGVSATSFDPDGHCTRGQIVTFLWRAAGEPTPGTATHPFTDVNPSAFYFEPMLWAVEGAITSGVTPTTFEPGSPCTRAQVVTFLWRAAGSPEPTAGGAS